MESAHIIRALTIIFGCYKNEYYQLTGGGEFNFRFKLNKNYTNKKELMTRLSFFKT